MFGGWGLGLFADGFDGAFGEGFAALGEAFFGVGLAEDVGVAAFFVAGEGVGGDFAAEVAVDAFLVDEEATVGVFGPFLGGISHGGEDGRRGAGRQRRRGRGGRSAGEILARPCGEGLAAEVEGVLPVPGGPGPGGVADDLDEGDWQVEGAGDGGDGVALHVDEPRSASHEFCAEGIAGDEAVAGGEEGTLGVEREEGAEGMAGEGGDGLVVEVVLEDGADREDPGQVLDQRTGGPEVEDVGGAGGGEGAGEPGGGAKLADSRKEDRPSQFAEGAGLFLEGDDEQRFARSGEVGGGTHHLLWKGCRRAGQVRGGL